MEIKGKFPNGLRHIFDRVGLSQAEFGRRTGFTRLRIKRWLDETRQIRPPDAEALAKPFGYKAEDILFPGRASDRAVPLVSWVSAGGLAQPRIVLTDDDILEMVRWSLEAKGDWIALRVEGDSMDRISPPDSIIFVNRRDKRLVSNACYIIADSEGNATYKRYRAGPARWEPVSTNKDHETSYVEQDGEPLIVGRVWRTLLSL